METISDDGYKQMEATPTPLVEYWYKRSLIAIGAILGYIFSPYILLILGLTDLFYRNPAFPGEFSEYRPREIAQEVWLRIRDSRQILMEWMKREKKIKKVE